MPLEQTERRKDLGTSAKVAMLASKEESVVTRANYFSAGEGELLI